MYHSQLVRGNLDVNIYVGSVFWYWDIRDLLLHV